MAEKLSVSSRSDGCRIVTTALMNNSVKPPRNSFAGRSKPIFTVERRTAKKANTASDSASSA